MSKYDALAQHLRQLKPDRWDASFSEIESILGFKLPESAREYPAWWANQLQGPRVQCRSWMNEGWQTLDLDLGNENVTFLRSSTRSQTGVTYANSEESKETLSEVVQASKLRISKVAGVVSDKVRISIDY